MGCDRKKRRRNNPYFFSMNMPCALQGIGQVGSSNGFCFDPVFAGVSFLPQLLTPQLLLSRLAQTSPSRFHMQRISQNQLVNPTGPAGLGPCQGPARDKLSGAEIHAIVQEAGMNAVRKNRYVILPSGQAPECCPPGLVCGGCQAAGLCTSLPLVGKYVCRLVVFFFLQQDVYWAER